MTKSMIVFDADDLSALDQKYFSIIFTDAFDVTVMSRNTGHNRCSQAFSFTKIIFTAIINMTYSCRVGFDMIEMERKKNEENTYGNSSAHSLR